MATRTATASLSLTLKSTIRNLLDDGGSAISTIGRTIESITLESGVSANQCNRVWHRNDIAISSGGFYDINISDMTGEDIGAGDGLDALGQAMDNEEIVTLAIKCVSGDGELEIMQTVPGAAPVAWIPAAYATNATKGGIKAGGVRLWHEPGTDGLDIGASSAVLRLGANGGDVVAEVFIIGRHDDDESSSSSASSSSSSTSSTT